MESEQTPTAAAAADDYIEKDGKWYDSEGRRVWRAGTLVYYKKDLIRMFFWLYVGQFSFFMEHIALPMLFPLLMAKKGFSALEIGSLWAIFPLGSLVLFPIIGTLSDRARTRWGRRRPFDLFTTPVWFVGLLMLPFCTEYWHALIAMILVGFAGAGSGVLNAFYNDVVPPELLGRFSAGMRWLGSIGGLVVQLGAMRLFDAHPVLIFIAIACIGFVGEMVMLYKVKEGEYPPPDRSPLMKTAFNFLKDGFANRYIICVWLAIGIMSLGGPVMGLYFSLFFTDAETGLGLSAMRLGQVMGIGTIIGLVLVLPAGWIVDRFGPVKIFARFSLIVGVCQILMFLFADSALKVTLFFCGYAAANTVLAATMIPLMFALIPRDKFGQLSGANMIVSRVLQIAGINLCGFIITASSNDYRYVFIVGGVTYMLVPCFLYLVGKQAYPFGDLKPTITSDS